MPGHDSRGYLGPVGSFAESAFRSVYPDVTGVAYDSIEAALDAVLTGRSQSVIVPVEHSIEGSALDTLDLLIERGEFMMRREMLVPVSCVLAVQPGVAFEDIATIATHPRAFHQCRTWLHDRLPGVTFLPTVSPANTAATLARGAAEHRQVGTLCSPAAASKNGLDVVVAGIADNTTPWTRFVELTKPGAPPEPTGVDTTSIALQPKVCRKSWLVDLLAEFVVRDIPVVRVLSRPAPRPDGAPTVAVDVTGHIEMTSVQDALRGVYGRCHRVVFLGSYPRYPMPAPPPDEDQVAAAQEADVTARRWVASLLGGEAS